MIFQMLQKALLWSKGLKTKFINAGWCTAEGWCRAKTDHKSLPLSLGQNFLLVDLQELFFRSRVEGTKKNK